jgi:hypothetical protein
VYNSKLTGVLLRKYNPEYFFQEAARFMEENNPNYPETESSLKKTAFWINAMS